MKTALKLKPYNGPAGPTQEQADHNTQVLAQELLKLEIPSKEDREYAQLLWGGDDLNLEIFHPTKPGQIIHAGYDRWGFCVEGDGCFDNIDQATLKETITAIKTWFFSK